MKSFFSIIKYDYLQRTRSYAFLITLCASLAIGFTFVPEPTANYSTIRISEYIGFYNSAWFGYVTAIMTSVFLSLIGFYLVNSGIKADVDTKVGQIVASTPVKNLIYLFGKLTSNFMVLLTIVFFVFLMSITLFFLYNDGYPFELLQFVKPYLFITIPAIFFIAALAVIFEVLIPKYTIVQNIAFFFLFAALAIVNLPEDSSFTMDVYGSKIVTSQMVEAVKGIDGSDGNSGLNIGYVIGNFKDTKRFQFEGVNFPTPFIISRVLWILFGIGLVALISPFFHRFGQKRWLPVKAVGEEIIHKEIRRNEIILSALPDAQTNYGILPFIKTEMLLLIRHGKKWLWIINLIGMALLALLPINIAHQFVLPILWFLQVGRLSELNTKEITYNVHYLAFTSYKPMGRLLLSQIVSGVMLLLVLAMPLIFRYAFLGDFITIVSIIFGGVFVIMLTSVLGILTKGKKLFEILFFMVTYANLNGIAFLDYFGGMPHNSWYLAKLIICCLFLGILSIAIRYSQLRR
ncbi:MAG: hypothetical protein AB8B59_18295 [Maribacter sp.]